MKEIPKAPASVSAPASDPADRSAQSVSGDCQDLLLRFVGALEDHLKSRSAVSENRVRDIVAQEIEQARIPQPIVIRQPNGRINKIEERVHAQFGELLETVEFGFQNILMVGPAGTGKTTLAHHLSKALGTEFGFLSLSAGITESHLFGRMIPQADGTWQYVPSKFIEIYENGGVFLFDELDSADANVMVSINAALANGSLADPNERMHRRHPNCIIIAAANTYGRGGDHMYVGRNQLDAATLDRFVLATLYVDYDRTLERDLACSTLPASQAEVLLSWMDHVRERIGACKLRRLASTRLLIGATLMMANGKTLEEVKNQFYKGWSAEERTQAEASADEAKPAVPAPADREAAVRQEPVHAAVY